MIYGGMEEMMYYRVKVNATYWWQKKEMYIIINCINLDQCYFSRYKDQYADLCDNVILIIFTGQEQPYWPLNMSKSKPLLYVTCKF